MTKDIVIVDIDHTVADAAWRDPLIGKWKEYHEASSRDKPIKFMADLILRLVPKYYIAAVTGRDEAYRALTIRWLIEHDILIDHLVMRPYGDYRPSPEMKCALVKAYFDLSKIAFVLEDRSDCCAAYFQLGLSVLQVSYNHGGKTNVEAAQAS